MALGSRSIHFLGPSNFNFIWACTYPDRTTVQFLEGQLLLDSQLLFKEQVVAEVELGTLIPDSFYRQLHTILDWWGAFSQLLSVLITSMS